MCQGFLGENSDPGDVITEHTCEVIRVGDNGVSETLGGYVFAQVLQAGLSANRGKSSFEACDCHSQEMIDLH